MSTFKDNLYFDVYLTASSKCSFGNGEKWCVLSNELCVTDRYFLWGYSTVTCDRVIWPTNHAHRASLKNAIACGNEKQKLCVETCKTHKNARIFLESSKVSFSSQTLLGNAKLVSNRVNHCSIDENMVSCSLLWLFILAAQSVALIESVASLKNHDKRQATCFRRTCDQTIIGRNLGWIQFWLVSTFSHI